MNLMNTIRYDELLRIIIEYKEKEYREKKNKSKKAKLKNQV